MRPLPRRSLAGLALAAALALPGCASLRADVARTSSLRSQLASYVFPKDLDAVWPEGLRLLSDDGFPLTGDDRERLGLHPQGAIRKLITPGSETHSVGDGLAAETDWNDARVRYRVEGQRVSPTSCRVTFIRIEEQESGNDDRAPDPEMTLDLVRRVDPAAAERIEAAADPRTR